MSKKSRGLNSLKDEISLDGQNSARKFIENGIPIPTDNIEVYENRIKPLVRQIQEVCYEYGIPHSMAFQTAFRVNKDGDTESMLAGATFCPPEGSGSQITAVHNTMIEVRSENEDDECDCDACKLKNVLKSLAAIAALSELLNTLKA